MSLRWSAGVWIIRSTGTRRLWRLTDDGWERGMWMGREVKDSQGRGREDEAGLERARREVRDVRRMRITMNEQRDTHRL